MSGLPKHRNWWQGELFDRAEIPAHVPRIEAFAATQVRSEARSRLQTPAWESMATWVRLIGRFEAVMQCSSQHHERIRGTARTLTADRIRECRHLDDLERAQQLLDDARRNPWCELSRAWEKAELGVLRVEVRNRIALLRMGRSAPKAKGSRFDVTRIPADRLDALIQSHPDLATVEALRAERERRFSLASEGP